MNINKLKQYIEQKYINVQQHPSADLFIYNYSQNTQFEGFWNDETLACRGLIMDGEGNVVARPFAKFFNYEELKTNQIPAEPFEVYDKMDGSLGILYWLGNSPQIATRGSFSSEQAIFATKLLHSKHGDSFKFLNKNRTYLFEIIYPQNRIVVDYGEDEKLVLLAVIDTKTGQDLELEDIGFEIVKRHSGLNDLKALKKLETNNQEGFVVKFKNGFRLKIKFEEYVRLHRILTQLSSLDIWEHLSQNKPLEEFLEKVPDEFFDWVKAQKESLEADYKLIENTCEAVFKPFDNRKEAAEYYLQQDYPMILFKMMDNRPYDHIIWKLVRPTFQKAFKNDFVNPQ